MDYTLLEKINSPTDLKELSDAELSCLCEEIRAFLIDAVEKSGGHLASNLGVTELSVALHKVFDSPRDHIIFDVGHQSYVHKLLTGRRADFETLRKPGGLSGFTKMSESEHDAFGSGHSSTSVSAALGYAESDRLKENGAYTVAVLGDGAYTGGMIHEALNNCAPDLKLIIVLNENGMSISVNKGTFATYLTEVRASKGYVDWKKGTKSFLSHIPLIGKPITTLLTFFKNKLKNLFLSSNYFEDLGLYYIGPIDGNDYKKVEKTLLKAKKLGKCVIVHLKTVKGKGYEPAESSPDGFHSINSSAERENDFHSVFAQELIRLAEGDKDIVAVTPAMGIGTGLDEFGKNFPDRYFDVGIAEEHAVTFSSGLAAAGLKPFVAIYSTFLQRAYDSILHDAALQSLPIKLMVDRAGLSLGDGATHHGIFDVAFLSHIPGISIASPATYESLKLSIEAASASSAPFAVRYPNKSECERVAVEFYGNSECELSLKANFKKDSAPERVYVTYGTICENVLSATDILKAQGIFAGVILLEILKPYGEVAKKAMPYLSGCKKIVFVEEGIKNGGAGMLFLDALHSLGFDLSKCSYDIIAIDDNFASPDELCDLYDYVGLSPKKIAEKMKNI